MFHNFLLGRLYPVHSKIHSMNPISKLLCFLLFIVISFFSATLPLCILLLVFIILFLNMTNISIRTYFTIIKFLIPIYLVAIIINLIMSISLFDTFIILLRFTFVIFYIMVLTLTTPFTELIYGLEKILFLFKLIGVNTSKLALSITLFFRSFSSLIDEINRIIKTEAGRGLDFYHSTVKEKILLFRSFIMPSLIFVERKNKELRKSMLLRLYSTRRKRTNFRMNKIGLFDGFMLFIHIILLFLVIKKAIL